MSNGFTAVITGGNKGIGAAVAQCMLDQEYGVISVSRHDPDFSHANLESVKADLLDGYGARAAAESRNNMRSHIWSTMRGWSGRNWSRTPHPTTCQAGSAASRLAATVAASFPSGDEDAEIRSRPLQLFARRAGHADPHRLWRLQGRMIGMARTWALELAPHGSP